jgi:hypothetical protein
MEQSNAESIDLNVDLASRCITSLQLLGDHEYVEGTWELVPAWDPELDQISNAELTDDPENDEDWTTNPALSRVGPSPRGGRSTALSRERWQVAGAAIIAAARRPSIISPAVASERLGTRCFD